MKRIVQLLLMTGVICTSYARSIRSLADSVGTKKHLVTILGKVKDDFTGADLNALVTLMRADSTVIDTLRSALQSEYSEAGYYFTDVAIEKGKYILKATLEGYDTAFVEKDIRFIGRNVGFNMPLLKMHRRMDSYEHELDEVTVTGTLVKLVHKGDTLVYNAQAFKLPDGSMLDGLIRQLPGAELKNNGDILINGRKIQNLTLNGDDFFRGNNKVMLENLPYFTVNQVKVYNKQTVESRKLGRDIAPREYTMDIVLKREYNRGYLANIAGGVGTKNRYTAQTFHLGYDDLNRFALYGNMNNLNQNPRPGAQGDWTPESMGDGENTMKKAGMEITVKEKEEKWKNSITTEAAWKDSHVERNTFRQQFMDSGDIFSIQNTINKASYFDWKASNKLELGQSFTLTAGADYHKQNNDDLQNDTSYTFEERINQNATIFGATKHKYAMTLDGYKNFDLPWGDIITLSAGGKYGRETYTNSDYSSINYFQTGENNSRLLTGSLPNHFYEFKGGLDYQLRLSNYSTIIPTIGYKQTYRNQRNDYLRDGAIDDNSSNAHYLTRRSSLGTTYLYFKNGENQQWTMFRFMPELTCESEQLRLSTPLAAYRPSRSEWLPSISADFSYQGSGGSNHVMLNYQLSTSTPSLGMMYGPQNTVDPLVTIYRNADLGKTMTQHFDGWGNFHFDWHSLDIGVSTYLNTAHGSVSYQKAMDANTGHYEYRPANVNGNWDGNASLNYDMPIDSLGLFTLSGATGYTYQHSVDFDISTSGLSSRLSKVNNGQFKQDLNLRYNKASFSLGLKSSFSATHVTSNRDGFTPFTYRSFDYGVNLSAPLFWQLSFVTDFTVFSRRGYAVSEMNQDDLVWNASLSRSFLKKKLNLSLEAYDLLHQLSKNTIVINAQARTELRVNTMPSYLMFRAQYHFNILPKNKR